ncbi:MAG: RNA polymerase sigma factor [Bacteroidetes bacterium]|nr:RNA polymerase sigma factor [Bacteroidota bacterium]
MKLNNSNDLLEGLVNGDSKSVAVIYETTLFKVKSFVLKNNGTVQDAEEIFQDALYQIIVRAKVKGLEITSSLEAYVFTVCKNLWYKELNNRKKKVRNEGVFELKENENADLEAILFQERWDLFEAMLLKLSEKCRLLLKDYFNKVTYSEIVKKFSYASENAAFQRVFKCKKQLGNLIKADARYQNLT